MYDVEATDQGSLIPSIAIKYFPDPWHRSAVLVLYLIDTLAMPHYYQVLFVHHCAWSLRFYPCTLRLFVHGCHHSLSAQGAQLIPHPKGYSARFTNRA